MNTLVKRREDILLKLLWFNIWLILFIILSFYWLTFLKSSVLEYSNIKSDKFDWTTYPIAYVPNWLKSKNTNKSIDFSSDTLWIDEFIELPKYDLKILSNTDTSNKEALLARYTYPVVYMWDYRLSYEENLWSHPWVDIRAPLWTPILSIANWVVIKVKNTETWDWKYVVIRHDDIDLWSWKETLYSSYEHLSDIFVEEWTKISRWDVLWKVWMTWITTTPHLHFQIDKKVAPFHPYWPFTFKEASDLNLDFFWWVNFWLWKENAIAYTINPMEFIQNNLSKETWLNSAPEQEDLSIEKNLALSDTSNTESTLESTWIAQEETLTWWSIQEETVVQNNEENITNTVNKNITNTEIQNETNSENTDTWIINNLNSITPELADDWRIFSDIWIKDELFDSTKYLYEKWITRWYPDKTFKSENTLTRNEAMIFIFKLYWIKTDSSRKLWFSDIESTDYIVPYLKKALDLWLIAPNSEFKPNDTVSKAEFVTMLIKASKFTVRNTWNTWYTDVKSSDWYAKYIETFNLVVLPSWKKEFKPNDIYNRGEIAKILYTFSKKA